MKYPGTYNARRDNLQGFWKGQFGHTHGLIVVNAFYENVTELNNLKNAASGEIDVTVVPESVFRFYLKTASQLKNRASTITNPSNPQAREVIQCCMRFSHMRS